jgi:hypothetical protein
MSLTEAYEVIDDSLQALFVSTEQLEIESFLHSQTLPSGFQPGCAE